jgi:hypothetical protein
MKLSVENKKYRTNILENDLNDRSNFPDLGFAKKLDKIEDEAEILFNKNTIEGYISSMIIYHQLMDELIKMLINCSRYYIQLRLFPYKINKRITKRKLTKNLLEELTNLLLNPKIELFIKKCYELNELRNKTVHRLITVKSVKSTLVQCKKVKRLFKEIFKLFEKIFHEILISMQNKEYFKNVEKSLGIDSIKIEKLLLEFKNQQQ